MKTKNINIAVWLMLMIFSGGVFAQDTISPPDTINNNRDMDREMRDMDQDDDQVVDEERRQKIIRDAEETKRIFSERYPESEDLFDTSVGYAIFPNVGKGAYILGGAAGNGVVYENGERVGFAELRQLDIGLQIGGQAYREIIFFETQDALNRFKEGEIEFGGNASAVIIEEGAARSVSFEDGVAVVIIPKAGAMVEASIGGQKFNYREIE